MPVESIPDPGRCPLCGGDNRCAMEAARNTGSAQPPCWCTTRIVKSELLARLPASAMGKACICPNCISAFDIVAGDERSAG